MFTNLIMNQYSKQHV